MNVYGQPRAFALGEPVLSKGRVGLQIRTFDLVGGGEMSLARHFLSCLFRLPVYQQPQQQQVTPSYGGYKEPATPVSIQRSAPGGGGVSNCSLLDEKMSDSKLGGPGCEVLAWVFRDPFRQGAQG